MVETTPVPIEFHTEIIEKNRDPELAKQGIMDLRNCYCRLFAMIPKGYIDIPEFHELMEGRDTIKFPHEIEGPNRMMIIEKIFDKIAENERLINKRLEKERLEKERLANEAWLKERLANEREECDPIRRHKIKNKKHKQKRKCTFDTWNFLKKNLVI